MQARERGQLRSESTLVLRRQGATCKLRLGYRHILQHHHRHRHIAALRTPGRRTPTVLSHGSHPAASSAMADTAARPQWPYATCPEHAFPATPITTIRSTHHTIRRTRDTITITPGDTVASRYLGWHTQRGAQEEDVIPQEATTVHGGQGPQGCYFAKHMFWVWQSQAAAYIVSLLRGWSDSIYLAWKGILANRCHSHQDQHLRPAQLGHPPTN
jgi:hypothetical protein